MEPDCALAGGVWFGGVSNLKVIVPIGAFAVASLGALWFGTRRTLADTAERAAA